MFHQLQWSVGQRRHTSHWTQPSAKMTRFSALPRRAAVGLAAPAAAPWLRHPIRADCPYPCRRPGAHSSNPNHCQGPSLQKACPCHHRRQPEAAVAQEGSQVDQHLRSIPACAGHQADWPTEQHQRPTPPNSASGATARKGARSKLCTHLRSKSSPNTLPQRPPTGGSYPGTSCPTWDRARPQLASAGCFGGSGCRQARRRQGHQEGSQLGEHLAHCHHRLRGSQAPPSRQRLQGEQWCPAEKLHPSQGQRRHREESQRLRVSRAPQAPRLSRRHRQAAWEVHPCACRRQHRPGQCRPCQRCPSQCRPGQR
mmetsp:Transcript_133076/g.332180  ORF Transcript_133076/g.332180 Transcript_133076/m.332180 type:complete len:311 (+) Transcript_133076:334-1266(+)